MNIIVSTTTLLKHLKSINGVLNSSNTIPILDNFLFELTPGNLVIHASDMETMVHTSVKVECKDAGSIAIPAKPLIDTLSAFPEQPLTFSIDTKVFGVKIITDNGEFKLTGHNGDEYPRFPRVEDSTAMVIKIINRAINWVRRLIFLSHCIFMLPAYSNFWLRLYLFGEIPASFLKVLLK